MIRFSARIFVNGNWKRTIIMIILKPNILFRWMQYHSLHTYYAKYLLNVSILLSSIVPPTIPPFASKPEPPKPRPINIFLWPVLPMDKRPSEWKSLVSHLQKAHAFHRLNHSTRWNSMLMKIITYVTLPITLPIFICTFNRLKFTVNKTKVCHAVLLDSLCCLRESSASDLRFLNSTK